MITFDFFAAARAAVLAASVLLPAAAAQAQPYPNRPINLIVPFPPGGPTDTSARLVAQHLQTALGQPVVVENRAGVAGIVGMQAAARAAPDGYTLVLGGLTTQVLNRALYAKLSYDPEKDFTAVALLTKVPYLLVANSSFPASTAQDVARLAKENPGKFNYGNPGGSGNTSHVGMEAFKKAAGLEIAQIPYQGDAQALTALMAGDVQIQFAVPLTVLPYLSSGRLKAIAMATPQRSAVLPHVPTFAEQGFPSVEAETWFSLLAPAGTPPAIVERLNHEVNKILEMPEVRARLKELGTTPGGGSLAEITAFMQSEYPKWLQRVKDSGATVN